MKVRAFCLECRAKSLAVDFEDRVRAHAVSTWAHAHVENMGERHMVILQRKKTVSWETITTIGQAPSALRSV